MKTDEFDYELDENLIAQTPLLKRDESRLLVLDKNNGGLYHKKFTDIIDYLNNNDILVINDTKVIPARIIGEKENTKAVIELLMLTNLKDNIWNCMVKPAKRIKVGTIIKFSDDLSAKCINKYDEGLADFEFIYNGILMEILEHLGTMPLPPYIKEQLNDKDRYQTIYAKNLGSAAAPTAGLHFTDELISKIKAKGITIVPVTLHVGLGTFRPVKVEDVTKHNMHEEVYMISEESAAILNQAKQKNMRIISVGTTTTRVLETNFHKYNNFKAETSSTNIFIYPGFKFKAIDGLITNFHLPKSTLLMLVSALSKKEYIINAYKEAVKEKYRFFSFGDAMFITEVKDEN